MSQLSQAAGTENHVDQPEIPGGEAHDFASVEEPDDQDMPAAAHISTRAAPMIASVAERALHEDPRFRDVWLRPGSRPGSIDIGGRLADPRALQLLHAFAERWGGIEIRLDPVALHGDDQPARH